MAEFEASSGEVAVEIDVGETESWESNDLFCVEAGEAMLTGRLYTASGVVGWPASSAPIPYML